MFGCLQKRPTFFLVLTHYKVCVLFRELPPLPSDQDAGSSDARHRCILMAGSGP